VFETKHAKFQRSSARVTFSNWGLNEGGRKFNGKLAISQKRWEIEPRLLLITNKKWHIGFQITWKLLTLDDLEGQYCNRNCIGCSAFSLETAGLSCFSRRPHFTHVSWLLHCRSLLTSFASCVCGGLCSCTDGGGVDRPPGVARLQQVRRRGTLLCRVPTVSDWEPGDERSSFTGARYLSRRLSATDERRV